METLARVPLETVISPDRPPVIVSSNNEDAGYRELMESLAKEPVPWKPLCEAVRHGDEAMTRKESEKFDGVQTISAKREAILSERPDILKILLERGNYIDDGLVAVACERKDRTCVRLFLDFGWPINNSVHFTASLLCMAVDDVKFTQWLIEAGADVNARNALDESALSIAIAHGHIDVVRLLITQGTDITHGDVLHCAAQRKEQAEGAEIAEELIERGADVNAYRHYNPVASRWRIMSSLLTPLHIACDKRNIPVADVLLRHGADPCRKLLSAGMPAPPTPLDGALELKDQELIDLLRSYERRDRASL